jgi:hypothetical protein
MLLDERYKVDRVTVEMERTPDGHPQVWLVYRREPYAPDSPEEREMDVWLRRCDVFTSRAEAVAFLDNLVGRRVVWEKYNPIFGELWIGGDRRQRWWMVPAPVNPPGGQR